MAYIVPVIVIVYLNVAFHSRKRADVPQIALEGSGRMSMDCTTGLMVRSEVKASTCTCTAPSSTGSARAVSSLTVLLLPWLVSHYLKYLGWQLESEGAETLWVFKYTFLMIFSSVKFLIYRFIWEEFRKSFLLYICGTDEDGGQSPRA